ncbi:RNA polymerase sigma factor [Nocardioides ungokensis]|uniref:RNA polymerase sigma factor n=1 Tax=Nocardioides ungokensis TaxID=1643322 RepID=UPI0015DE9C4B|nr:sigma-70 family RNA polymerase sigma factor [Nocardioides ungokensis]
MGVDDREFEELFDAEFSGVVRAVFVVCQDIGRAEDVAQEAFLELLRHWGRVSRYDRPGAWVRRVAIRKAVQVTKREARRSWFERRAAASTVSDALSPVGADDALWAAVRSLPAQQRAVVALFYYEDLSVEDVAGVLGCSVSTVKVHLHRARESLRTCVSRAEGL